MSRYDALVVLGYPTETPGDILQHRLAKAQRYAERHRVPVIIVSGDGRLKNNEADYMAAWLKMHHFQGRVIKERRAWDTIENFVYSQEICVAEGFTRVLAVTSWFHVPRSIILMRMFMHQSHFLVVWGGSIQLLWPDLGFIRTIKASARKRGFWE